MELDFEKLAERFDIGSQFMDDDERLILSTAIETVVLEKQAGRLASEMSEDEIVLLGAALADELLKE